MKKLFLTIFLTLCSINIIYATQSTITEAEGYACLNEDRTMRQTEQAALSDAKRNAAEKVITYIQSETKIKNFELQEDIVKAYNNSNIKVLESIGKWESEPPKIGTCYRIKIKAEVIPEETTIKNIAKSILDDPMAPLTVQLWTDKKEYTIGDKIKVYIKGNKPFFARVIYKDASGELIQLLPNPYRKNNYFNGGIIYEIPSGEDKFELEITPPIGNESLIVYASVSQLGDLNLIQEGGIFKVKMDKKDVSDKTRGLKIKGIDSNNKASDFFEMEVAVNVK